MTDDLGARLKANYEDRARICLPRRTYTIIRIDGKAFHTYTRGLVKPFDADLVNAFDESAQSLCKQAMGCRFAYGQSDEYSFLLTDFASNQTEAWFDGNMQKIVSVSASIFTAEFNRIRREQGCTRTAYFDSRVFTIPDAIEVENYFIWRQQDCVRNSLLSSGHARFSPKQMHGKNTSEVHDMLHEVGINWNDLPVHLKRGRVIKKQYRERDVEFTHKRTKQTHRETITESYWGVDADIPTFTANRAYLKALIQDEKAVAA